MSSTTTNIGLTKPAMTDTWANIIPGIASSMDTIDGKIGILSNFMNDNAIDAKNPPSPLAACKGDGTSGDAANLQAILNYASANNRNVRIPSGVYGIETMVTWDGKTTIFGDGDYVVLKALNAMEAVLDVSKDNNNLVDSYGGFRFGNLIGIQINGNNIAQKCLKIEMGKGFKFFQLYCTGAIDQLIQVGATGATWEVIMKDVYLTGGNTTANLPNYCLNVTSNCTDSIFENIIANNAKTNIYNFSGSALRVKNIHGYGYPKTNSCNYTVLVGGTFNIFDQVYTDTPLIGGIKVTGTANIFNNVIAYFVKNAGDATAGYEGIRIEATGNLINNLVVKDSGFAQADADLSSMVIVNNSPYAIYDVSVDGVSSSTSYLWQNSVKIIGQLPDRTNLRKLPTSTTRWYSGLSNFVNTGVSSGATSISFTFNVPRASSSYLVVVNPSWQTTFVVSTTTTGFTVTFGTAPASTGTIWCKVLDYIDTIF